MQSSRIKISTVGPDQRVDFGINTNLIEYGQVAQRSKQLTAQDGLKVDGLVGAIFEVDSQCEGRFDLE